MGSCSSSNSPKGSQPTIGSNQPASGNRNTNELSLDEVQAGLIASMLCDMSYESTTSVADLLEVCGILKLYFYLFIYLYFRDFFFLKFARTKLKLKNEITNLKIWDVNGNRALTMTVRMDCKAIGLSENNYPIPIEVVVFRGTSDVHEIGQDAISGFKTEFNIKASNGKTGRSLGQVAEGFYNAYTNFRDHSGLYGHVLKGAMNSGRKLLITGHSLGAAVAQCLSTEILHRRELGMQIALITFGSPR
jgi:hypothetical protein